ncbi:MBL fold metallo-hydrolase [Aestuariivirga sp.]|uniref:MBL fold metallo-hydrolase n=1 Tax=Aestuariivirga sp. TaxID=2650926 RepID=UPI003BA9F48E
MVKLLHDGRRFRIEGHRGQAGFRELLKWQMNGERARWPSHAGNQTFAAPPEQVEGEALKATWIGHSTVLLQTDGINILTDPFLSSRASPVAFAGPKRARAPALTAETLPRIDLILLSHNHYDHMDLRALRQISRLHQPHVVTPVGNARWIRRASSTFKIDELQWGESTVTGGLRIHLTPALHWSKRGLFDANTALWGAFVVEAPGGHIYFAGDTGFGTGATFSAVRERFGRPRLSLLPIGAYEPRWFMAPQHMNPDEAVKAHRLLDSRTSLAIHHGTIQLTDEAIGAPAAALATALTDQAVDPSRFLVPDAGAVVTID